MPNYTTNYNLTKPLESELYDINVQNENLDKIDEALKNATNSVNTDTDPGAGIEVDYPNGTEINVYE